MDIFFGSTNKAPIQWIWSILNLSTVTTSSTLHFKLKSYLCLFGYGHDLIQIFLTRNSTISQGYGHPISRLYPSSYPSNVRNKILADLIFFPKVFQQKRYGATTMLFIATKHNYAILKC